MIQRARTEGKGEAVKLSDRVGLTLSLQLDRLDFKSPVLVLCNQSAAFEQKEVGATKWFGCTESEK